MWWPAQAAHNALIMQRSANKPGSSCDKDTTSCVLRTFSLRQTCLHVGCTDGTWSTCSMTMDIPKVSEKATAAHVCILQAAPTSCNDTYLTVADVAEIFSMLIGVRWEFS